MESRPVFIAHRAGGKGVSENRLETIRECLQKDYVDGIEIDLRVTKDNVLIVHHDRGVYINGTRVWTEKLNYDEIKHLGIPTLEEVVEIVAPTDKILNLDIKEENVISALQLFMKKKRFKKKFYLDCYDIDLLLKLERELPNCEYFYSLQPKDSRDFSRRFVVRILILSIALLFSQLIVYLLRKKLKKVKIEGLTVYHKFATKEFIRDLKLFGYKVVVWGSDDPKRLTEFFHRGVYGIKTKNFAVMEKLHS